MSKNRQAARIVLLVLLPFILVPAFYLADFKCPDLHLKLFKNLFSWNPYDVEPVWMPDGQTGWGRPAERNCGLPLTIIVFGGKENPFLYNYTAFAVNLLVWLALFVTVWVVVFRKIGRQ